MNSPNPRIDEDTLAHQYLDILEEVVAVAVEIDPDSERPAFVADNRFRIDLINRAAYILVALGIQARATADAVNDIISTDEPTA